MHRGVVMFTSSLSVLTAIRSSSDRNELWASLFALAGWYARTALGLTRRYASQAQEDCLHQAVYQALDSIHRYRHGFRGETEGEARAWVRMIVANAAKKEARRQAVLQSRFVWHDPDDLIRISDRCRVVSEPQMLREEAISILEARVGNRGWREMWLLYNDPDRRLSVEQISALTGRTVGTVRVTLSRVRTAIGGEFSSAVPGRRRIRTSHAA